MDSKKIAAEELLGLELDDGWLVVERAVTRTGATGGNFSVGYIVESPEGATAFLKALDYSRAFGSQDPVEVLRYLTSAFVFERDLLLRCREKGLSRIVRAIGHGKIEVPGVTQLPWVDYLIFEKAEDDIRAFLDKMQTFDLVWILRACRDAGAAIQQLHTHRMAHQDVKPSNVLVFADDSSKLTDLGRGAYEGHTAPHENAIPQGDPAHAPPESLYGYAPTEWVDRCKGCDSYLYGSLIGFLFTKVSMTSAILTQLPQSFFPGTWGGSYEDVLPYLRDAYDRALVLLSAPIPEPVREAVSEIIRQLCDPDFQLRGHPRNRLGAQNPFGLERYVTRLDLLMRRARLGLL